MVQTKSILQQTEINTGANPPDDSHRVNVQNQYILPSLSFISVYRSIIHTFTINCLTFFYRQYNQHKSYILKIN